MHDEPGDSDVARSRGDVETGLSEFLDFVKDLDAQRNHFARSRIRDVDEPALSPVGNRFRQPSVGTRDRCPRHQSFHTIVPRRVKNRDPSSTRVPEQTVTVFHPVAHSCLAHYGVEIVELLEVRVVSECITMGEILAIFADPASGKIERDRTISCLREFLSEIGEEREVREPLEPVADHHRAGGVLRNACLSPDDEWRLIAAVAPQLEFVELDQRSFLVVHYSTSPPASTQPRKPSDMDATSV